MTNIWVTSTFWLFTNNAAMNNDLQIFFIAVKYMWHKIYHPNHVLSTHCYGSKYVHSVVQPSPPSSSRTFSSSQTEILCPLNNKLPFSPPPVEHNSTFSMNLTILCTAYRQNHPIFALLWLATLFSMSSILIPVIARITISFLFKAA